MLRERLAVMGGVVGGLLVIGGIAGAAEPERIPVLPAGWAVTRGPSRPPTEMIGRGPGDAAERRVATWRQTPEASRLFQAVERHLREGGTAQSLIEALNGASGSPRPASATSCAGSFGPRTRVDDTAAPEFSRTVKITGIHANHKPFDGSGVLVDAKWVLTAGHLVYDSDEGGWTTDLTIIPGYNNGRQPFGQTDWVRGWAYDAWRNERDFDYDIAFVELAEPIGMRAGWAGFGTENDGFFCNRQFEHAGYPGEEGYDGELMYRRSGSFLGTTAGNAVRMRPSPIGGESGSGYAIDGIVYAVTSYSTADGTGGAIRVWSDAFDDLKNTHIDAGTPQAPDLIPFDVRAGAIGSNIRRTLDSPQVEFRVHNYSRSEFRGGITVAIYLSSNQTITTADELLAVRTLPDVTIGAKQTRVCIVNTPVVPGRIKLGRKYIGVIIRNADADESNNTVGSQDVSRVWVRKRNWRP